MRSVCLQTFFRGTKIRYFEVAPHDPSETLEAVERFNESQGQTLRSVAEPVQDANAAVGPQLPPQLSGVDLPNLQHFHHFLSDTSLTLPALDPNHSTELYWHHEFVAQALLQQW